MTIITTGNAKNAKNEAILPAAGNLKSHAGCNNKKHVYTLNGTTHTSPELVFGDLTNKVSVPRNQEMKIWYGQDWVDCYESENNGATCMC